MQTCKKEAKRREKAPRIRKTTHLNHLRHPIARPVGSNSTLPSSATTHPPLPRAEYPSSLHTSLTRSRAPHASGASFSIRGPSSHAACACSRSCEHTHVCEGRGPATVREEDCRDPTQPSLIPRSSNNAEKQGVDGAQGRVNGNSVYRQVFASEPRTLRPRPTSLRSAILTRWQLATHLECRILAMRAASGPQ